MEKTRILLASDIHWCHLQWYGMENNARLAKFVSDVAAEHKSDPCAALLLLGDYSLDHWAWGIKGSWLNEGVSNTANFVDAHMEELRGTGMELRMIAGNHEQYGEEKWREITGFSRQSSIVCGDVLFILLDTYGADLDPTEHSDGTYAPADMAFIRREMAANPDKRVILCAHYFDAAKESEEFCRLVREDTRILCLIAGHVHTSYVVTPEQFGTKPLLFTGHYSYSGTKPDPLRCPCGYREVVIDGAHVTSAYIAAENTYAVDGKTVKLSRSRQDEIILA